MSTEHEDVRDLLAAWAVGALTPADEKTVPLHLAECESCAAEAERLRETVRLLDGPRGMDAEALSRGPRDAAANGVSAGESPERGRATDARPTEPGAGDPLDVSANGVQEGASAGRGRAADAWSAEPGAGDRLDGCADGVQEGASVGRGRAGDAQVAEPGAARSRRVAEGPGFADTPHATAPAALLALALRSRPATPQVAPHAAPYAAAVAGLQALLREVDGQGPWGTPVVHDWDVHATVAHLVAADEPLARRLGLAARMPESRGAEGARWEDAWAARTAEVIAYEQRRAPEETVAAWTAQAGALLATPEARDPERAAHATTLMGVRLPVADHFVVRAFEVWIHTDDIGRALGLAVPPPPEPHLWQLVRLAVRILGMALGSTAPPVLFAVTGRGRDAQWVLGSEDEPVRAELVLDPVDFCLLVGGRHAPDEVPRGATGDERAVRNVLERAASLAWL